MRTLVLIGALLVVSPVAGRGWRMARPNLNDRCGYLYPADSASDAVYDAKGHAWAKCENALLDGEEAESAKDDREVAEEAARSSAMIDAQWTARQTGEAISDAIHQANMDAIGYANHVKAEASVPVYHPH